MFQIPMSFSEHVLRNFSVSLSSFPQIIVSEKPFYVGETKEGEKQGPLLYSRQTHAEGDSSVFACQQLFSRERASEIPKECFRKIDIEHFILSSTRGLPANISECCQLKTKHHFFPFRWERTATS